MDLPVNDHAYLRREGFDYEVFEDGGMLCVQLSRVALPSGLNATEADILLRLAPLYDDVPPDMWWINPALTTAQGGTIPATEHHETYRDRVWQRWSRHLPPGSWLAGIDSLESYLALIQAELRTAAGSTE
ncbi:E2/UBC family protein [Streptomyces phaeochromogenes]|uniref:E2/UBC family protein n=1 Tax=Streptomyces phaeochromogenes TaxID=1923 RepID=UPI003718D2BD